MATKDIKNKAGEVIGLWDYDCDGTNELDLSGTTAELKITIGELKEKAEYVGKLAKFAVKHSGLDQNTAKDINDLIDGAVDLVPGGTVVVIAGIIGKPTTLYCKGDSGPAKHLSYAVYQGVYIVATAKEGPASGQFFFHKWDLIAHDDEKCQCPAATKETGFLGPGGREIFASAIDLKVPSVEGCGGSPLVEIQGSAPAESGRSPRQAKKKKRVQQS